MLLAIDSATQILSLALHNGDQIISESTWTTPNRHTVELMPAIQQLLGRSRLSPTDLTGLAVSQGPGSFNGLRIGFSAAKGLSLALTIPLIAIPTLDILAEAQPCFDGILIAVLQAGRGRVCTQSYHWNGESWVGQEDLRIVSWHSLIESIGTDNAMICGEIDLEGRTLIRIAADEGKPVLIASAAVCLRRAGFLADLAWCRLREGRTDDPASVTPIYLHQPGVSHP
jgi:tRNA threonylcarbamoyladenosine biosynthesis protein TsaB